MCRDGAESSGSANPADGYLSRAPDPWHGDWGTDEPLEVWPPRSESSGAGRANRSCPHYFAKSRVSGGRGLGSTRYGVLHQSDQSERSISRGVGSRDVAGLLGPVPPGRLARPTGQSVLVRSIRTYV